MISQNSTDTQEILKSIFANYPIILYDTNHIYLLVGSPNDDLTKVIEEGINDTGVIQIFADEKGKETLSQWKRLGFTVRYINQQIECMNHVVNIRYPQIANPANCKKISLIPWYISPGKPYCVYVYLYAAWYYHTTGRKSMWLTAKATGRIFGISSFNKSTVCRNIKAMERYLNQNCSNAPISTEERGLSSTSDFIEIVPTILSSSITADAPEATYEAKTMPIPAPNGQAGKVSTILEGIPREYAEVIKPKEKITKKSRGTHTTTLKTKRKQHVQRSPVYIANSKIWDIRTKFIEISRRLIINEAIERHRLIITAIKN
jgi:hypothetical protein